MVAVTGLALLMGCTRTAEKKAPAPICVAHVKGVCIEKKSLRPAYRFVGGHGLPGMTEAALARYVLDGAIERELLAQEAEKEGLKVTDAELDELTKDGVIYLTTPSAQPTSPQLGLDAGRSSIDEVLASRSEKAKEETKEEETNREKALKTFVNATPAEYRAWQARELLAAKMRAKIGADVTVKDEDAFRRFVDERSTATADYVVVFREWVERYAVPVDDKKVDAWAAANPSKVITPVRHILATGQNEAELAKAKVKAEEVLARVKKGEDWDTLAKQYSEDNETKDKGGLYDGEAVLDFVEEFVAAVKKIKPGETGPEVVKTAYGWHVLRRDPATHEMNVKSYIKDRADGLTTSIGDEVLAAAKGGKSLAAAAAAALEKHGRYGKGAAEAKADNERPKVETTRPFHRTEEPLQLISPTVEQEIADFAFKAQPNELAPKPWVTLTGATIVQAKSRFVPTQEDFAKEREAFVGHLVQLKREAVVRKHVKELREASKADITIDEARLLSKPDGGTLAGGPPGAGAAPAEISEPAAAPSAE